MNTIALDVFGALPLVARAHVCSFLEPIHLVFLLILGEWRAWENAAEWVLRRTKNFATIDIEVGLHRLVGVKNGVISTIRVQFAEESGENDFRIDFKRSSGRKGERMLDREGIQEQVIFCGSEDVGASMNEVLDLITSRFCVQNIRNVQFDVDVIDDPLELLEVILAGRSVKTLKLSGKTSVDGWRLSQILRMIEPSEELEVAVRIDGTFDTKMLGVTRFHALNAIGLTRDQWKGMNLKIGRFGRIFEASHFNAFLTSWLGGKNENVETLEIEMESENEFFAQIGTVFEGMTTDAWDAAVRERKAVDKVRTVSQYNLHFVDCNLENSADLVRSDGKIGTICVDTHASRTLMRFIVWEDRFPMQSKIRELLLRLAETGKSMQNASEELLEEVTEATETFGTLQIMKMEAPSQFLRLGSEGRKLFDEVRCKQEIERSLRSYLN